jgi:glycoside/pentoside/hexuronide:cation symporter, GPH family
MTKNNHNNIVSTHFWSLGLGFFASFFIGQGISILAIPYYQMTLGVNPSALGILMALPMLISSIAGIYIGHLIDKVSFFQRNTQSIMRLMAILLASSYGIIWMVPTDHSAKYQLIYFAFFSSLFQFAGAIYNILLYRQVYNSSTDSRIRTRLIGNATYFTKTGSLLYQWMFPISQLIGWGGVAIGVPLVGWLIALIIFLFCGLAPSLHTINNIIDETIDITKNAKFQNDRNFFYQRLIAIIHRKEIRFIAILIMLQMGGVAFVSSMDYYLLVYHVHHGQIAAGAIDKAWLSSAYALVSIMSIPIILQLIKRYSRLNILLSLFLFSALGALCKWILFAPDIGKWILLDALLCGPIWCGMVLIIPSLIGDIVHQDKNLHLQDNSGFYGAAYGWLLSSCTIVVLIASGVTLDLIHFDSTLAEKQSVSSILSMRQILSFGTFVFSLLALLTIARWKSNNHNHIFNH